MNRLALCQDENQHHGYAEIANLVCNNSLKGFLGLIPKSFLRKSQRRIKMKNWIGKNWLETKYNIGNYCFSIAYEVILLSFAKWSSFYCSILFHIDREGLCPSKSSIFVFIADRISEGRSMVLLTIYHSLIFNF